MLLVIDRGNSFTKLAAFRNDTLVEHRQEKIFKPTVIRSFVNHLMETYPNDKPTNGIFSSVAENYDEEFTKAGNLLAFIVLSPTLPLPIKNRYGTPETLGNDRIAGVVGAAGLHPGKNVLVIDSGSCITYDLITKEKEYLGGGIAPGIGMRFKALNTFTARLPLVSQDGENPIIGHSTETSIRSGVLKGVLAEVEGMIALYRKTFPDLTVVITGGDVNYFERNIKSNIFAVPNLVLYGLLDILKYNVDL